jgi:hypothetical protein
MSQFERIQSTCLTENLYMVNWRLSIVLVYLCANPVIIMSLTLGIYVVKDPVLPLTASSKKNDAIYVLQNIKIVSGKGLWYTTCWNDRDVTDSCMFISLVVRSNIRRKRVLSRENAESDERMMGTEQISQKKNRNGTKCWGCLPQLWQLCNNVAAGEM